MRVDMCINRDNVGGPSSRHESRVRLMTHSSTRSFTFFSRTMLTRVRTCVLARAQTRRHAQMHRCVDARAISFPACACTLTRVRAHTHSQRHFFLGLHVHGDFVRHERPMAVGPCAAVAGAAYERAPCINRSKGPLCPLCRLLRCRRARLAMRNLSCV